MPKKRKTKKPAPESYQKRSYRNLVDTEGLVSSRVTIRETDLHVLASSEVTQEAEHLVIQLRNQLERYIAGHPAFLSSLKPIETDPVAPALVKDMIKGSIVAEVGPMAAVAGGIAEHVGKALLADQADEVIIENGGDIYLKRNKDVTISIFAGTSPLSHKVGIRIAKERMPLGICTSSGTVGHSLSLGRADSVTVLSESTCVADAAATRLGNEIKSENDINKALDIAKSMHGVDGVVIIVNDKIGAWGAVELVRVE